MVDRRWTRTFATDEPGGAAAACASAAAAQNPSPVLTRDGTEIAVQLNPEAQPPVPTEPVVPVVRITPVVFSVQSEPASPSV